MPERDVEDFIAHWKGSAPPPADVAEILKTLETFGRACQQGRQIFTLTSDGGNVDIWLYADKLTLFFYARTAN